VTEAARFAFVFRYPAEVDEWHDGDTCYVHLHIRPGLEIHGQHVRVEGINAPELHAAGGTASRDYAKQLVPPGTLVTLTATKEEKYGRLLAKVTLPDGRDFSELMVQAGQAIPFMA
jgi:endonuclease YncB( thermonuclease family)